MGKTKPECLLADSLARTDFSDAAAVNRWRWTRYMQPDAASAAIERKLKGIY
jgi:hypothetical protein